MAAILIPNGSTFRGVVPMVDTDLTTLIGLTLCLNLHCSDPTHELSDIDVPVEFDAWAVLSSDEKTAMQGISNTLQAHIVATYFT
jgi:hypothetical protein